MEKIPTDTQIRTLLGRGSTSAIKALVRLGYGADEAERDGQKEHDHAMLPALQAHFLFDKSSA
jgi:hypothetical protein